MTTNLQERTPREQRPSSAGRCVPWLVLLLAAVLVALGLAGLDRWFYEHVSCVLNTTDHRPLDRCFYSLTKPFWLVCRLAFGHVIGGTVIYGLIVARHPRRWSAATAGLVAVVVAATIANVSQRAIGRLRPNQADGHLAFTQPALGLLHRAPVSLPSGEATTAFALACVLTRLFPRWRAVFLVFAVLAASSRLVNGAHYLSDVGAGAMLGVLVVKPLLTLALRRWPDAGLARSRPE